MDRVVPHNIEAEEAVIGSLLIGGEFNKANLSPGDFFSDACAAAYAACQKLSDKGVSINEITVSQALKEAGALEKVGGAAYLAHLVSICPTSLDLPYYADIVRRLSISRQQIQVGAEIQNIGYRAGDDINKSLTEADDLLVALRRRVNLGDATISPDQRVEILSDRYAKLYSAEKGIAISTGIRALDEAIGGGFFPGELIIIGASTGMGKTSLLLGMANCISKDNIVLFCSGEMRMEDLSDRDVAGWLGEDISKVRSGSYSEITYQKISGFILEKLRERRIHFLDKDTAFDFPNIKQSALRIQARYGLKIIFVDYLGLLTDQVGENQNIRLGILTRNLKQLGRYLGVPIVLVCQLSRAHELRDDKRPLTSDLRESGNIENHADDVIMLYRQSYYTHDSQDITTEIIVRKLRQGDSTYADKVVIVHFDQKFQTYKEMSNYEELAKQEVQLGF